MGPLHREHLENYFAQLESHTYCLNAVPAYRSNLAKTRFPVQKDKNVPFWKFFSCSDMQNEHVRSCIDKVSVRIIFNNHTAERWKTQEHTDMSDSLETNRFCNPWVNY